MNNKFIDDDKLDSSYDVNRENEDIYNSIIENSKPKDDGYLDRNNPFVKAVLSILFLIAFVGVIYYLYVWYNM